MNMESFAGQCGCEELSGIHRKRRIAGWRGFLGGTLAIALLAGCAGGDGPAGAVRGGQVVIAEGADLDKPLGLVSSTSLDSSIGSMLYMTMLGTRWENGELIYQTAEDNPLALARSYEFFGPDSASIRYRMRSDVRWTDGRPVTAEDAAWTLRAQGNEAVASPRQDYNREIREIVVEDDSTLVIHFNRRYAEMFFHTAGDVAPRHLFEDGDLSQLRSHPALTDPVNSLVTNGPFRLVQWVRGQSVVLERNPDFEPQPILDRIIFRIIPEEATRIIELQTGRVDITRVPFHYVDEIRNSTGIRIEKQEKRSSESIQYNPRSHPFLADPEIRRALGLAIDKEAMIAGLEMEEFAVSAGGPYPPIFRNLYDPEGQSPLPYDTVEARRILESRGWVRGPDGILTNDGTRFSFQILTNGDNRRRVDIAQILERQWQRLGIETRIQTLEFNTVIERTTAREFEAHIGGWNVGLSADLYQLWGDVNLPFNYVSYDNAEVRRLMNEAVAQPTEDEANALWKQAAALIVADQPYTWLFYYDTPFGVNERVKGIRIDTLSPYQEPWAWYIEE